jgi:hypothetical protein
MKTRIQERFNYFDFEDVLIGVQPLRAAARGCHERGMDESGAIPIIELTVGDAGEPADLRAAVSIGECSHN